MSGKWVALASVAVVAAWLASSLRAVPDAALVPTPATVPLCPEHPRLSPVPCLIRNAPWVATWEALGKDAAWYSDQVRALRTHAPFPVTVKATRDTLYRRNDPLLALPLAADQAHDQLMTFAQLVQELGRASSTHHVYASLAVRSLPTVLSVVHPHANFSANPLKPAHVLLWWGSRDATATPHYDYDANIVVQLAGTKRWSLWAPNSSLAHTLYPAASPYARQARPEHFAATAQVAVDLHEGMVLWVPTCWFHRVRCISAQCVSVNFWHEDLATSLEDSKEALGLVVDGAMKRLAREHGIGADASLFAFVALFATEAAEPTLLRRLAADRYDPVFGAVAPGPCPLEWSPPHVAATVAALQPLASRLATLHAPLPADGTRYLMVANTAEKLLVAQLGQRAHACMVNCAFPRTMD